MTPEERAIYASQQAKARGIDIYSISVEQTIAGTEFMRQISSTTLLNIAQGKSATQITTQTDNYAANGVDANTDNTARAQTTSVSEARREVDL